MSNKFTYDSFRNNINPAILINKIGCVHQRRIDYLLSEISKRCDNLLVNIIEILIFTDYDISNNQTISKIKQNFFFD